MNRQTCINRTNAWIVAQIFNLPYRRFAIGWPSSNSVRLEISNSPRNAIPRYSRIRFCATVSERGQPCPREFRPLPLIRGQGCPRSCP